MQFAALKPVAAQHGIGVFNNRMNLFETRELTLSVRRRGLCLAGTPQITGNYIFVLIR